jgi:hypothetical protein
MLRYCWQNRPCKHHLFGKYVKWFGRERTPKGPTVDGVINPVIHAVDFLAKVVGINVDLGLVSRDEIIELGIEYSDDLGALIVHDCFVLLVPKDGDGEPVRRLRDRLWTSDHGLADGPSAVTWVGSEIQILDVFRPVQGVDVRRRELVDIRERPAPLAHTGGDYGDGWMRGQI